jgi:phosphoribosyl 1,2-cyclic phosphate phosphodiesterase
MKLQYFGTAAAEGIPGVFCNCQQCQEARAKKGKYIRTRSQAMLDDELLIDFNADTYAHSLAYDINLANLEHVLITHVHEDHYYPVEFFNRQEWFAHDMKNPTLTVHGSEDVEISARAQWSALNADPNRLTDQKRLAFQQIKPYETQTIAGFEVTALPADHGTAHPYIYVIAKNGKTMLYFNDSGLLSEETMAFLKEKGIQFDLVSYDCTFGKRSSGGRNHMGVPDNIEARKRFIENGNYKDTTISIITHFSHNNPNVGYDDMLKVAQENGFMLSYDGMIIEF